MNQLHPLLMTGYAWLAFAIVMTLAWAAAIRRRFISLVDAVWAVGIGVCGATYALVSHTERGRSVMVGFMALLWGLRLGIHLIKRLWRHYPEEDSRYVALKHRWRAGFLWKSFLFFQFQALLQAVFSYPFAAMATSAAPFPQSVEVVGALMFAGSVFGEAMADAQLQRFNADPNHRGKVCNVGLWRYSRHPNYFFEWMIWCGLAIVAAQAPYGALALAAPALMLVLLLFVTGVAPAEAQSLKSRGDAYRLYQSQTSRFIPWFPKGEKRVG